MPWEKRNPDLSNDPAYLEPRLNDLDAQLAEKAKAIGVNIVEYPRQAGETHDIPRFQRAIDYLSSVGGGRLVVPNIGEDYVFTASNPTIQNPTRVLISSDNIEIIGVGLPNILMNGINATYLTSIDDLASSGRDVFTAFSFRRVKNCKISGIRFKGTYSGDENFRYQSPRAKAVGFIGVDGCIAENLYGEDILGNLVNATPSDSSIDGLYKPLSNVKIINCHAKHCWENGFNFMGNTTDCIISESSAILCANGMESACVNFTAINNLFKANKSAGMAISGDNSTANGNVCTDTKKLNTDASVDNTVGYGVVLGAGKNIVLSNNVINNNVNFGVYIYPAVSKAIISSNIMNENATDAQYKANIYITANSSKPITDITIIGNRGNLLGTVAFVNANFAKRITIKSNDFTLDSASSAVVINSGCVDCKILDNNFNKPVSVLDNTSVESNNSYYYRIIDRSSYPTGGTFMSGDIVRIRQPILGSASEYRCIQSGTLGTLNGGATTGSISSGSAILTVNSATGLYEGAFITIAGVTGVKKVVSISGTSITLDSPADVTVSAAAVAYRQALLKATQQLEATTSISSAPSFVGQISVVGGIIYMASGTSTASDWKQIS